MAKVMVSAEGASLARLAGVLEGYLRGEKWATERRMEGELTKSHDADEPRVVLESDRFRYLHDINPGRLQHVRDKFLGVNREPSATA